MASDTQAIAPATATAPVIPLYRLTVRQFAKMCDAGVFPHGAHVELLGGILVETMTTNDPHEFTVGTFGDLLRPLHPAGWIVREEKSLRLGRYWRPQPDLAVVSGRRVDYLTRTPRASDVALLIEVSDTSYARDRGIKWRRYAAARIPYYGIADLGKKQVELHGNPTGRGPAASYQDCVIYGRDDTFPVVIEGIEAGRIAVKDLVP